jgi:hypothetical protein
VVALDSGTSVAVASGKVGERPVAYLSSLPFFKLVGLLGGTAFPSNVVPCVEPAE